MTRAEARRWIQARFKRAVDRDVSSLVADRLGHEATLRTCAELNRVVSDSVWSHFSADWRKVALNPGGTSGRAATFLQLKTELVYALAVLDGARTEEVRELERELSLSLDLLWLEWAGYMVTSEPELVTALD